MKIWVAISFILIVTAVSVIALSATADSPDFIKSGVSFGSLATAGILNKQGMHQESLGFSERALELYPDNYDAVKETAQAHIGLNDYESAVSVYDNYIESENGDVEHRVWYDKAEIYKAAGDSDKATECYNAVVESCNYQLAYYPDDALLLRELGAMHMTTGSYGGALATYEKIIENTPDDARAWLDKGDVYLMMSTRDEEELNRMYKSLIEGEVYSGASIPDTGVFDSYEKAHEAYMKAIELDPKLYPAVVSRFMSHYQHSAEIYSDIINI